MALPTAASDRQLEHRRRIDVQVYARGNGLWEVDAHISDVRPEETAMVTGVLPGGQPIHEMLLRLVVDQRFNIVDAGEVLDTRGETESSTQPFQIDRCHALRADGATVKTYCPRWYRAPAPGAVAATPTSAATVPSET